MTLTPARLVLWGPATALARLGPSPETPSSTRPGLRYVQAMDRTGHPKLAELAVCPWCISMWIGAVVAVAADL